MLRSSEVYPDSQQMASRAALSRQGRSLRPKFVRRNKRQILPHAWADFADSSHRTRIPRLADADAYSRRTGHSPHNPVPMRGKLMKRIFRCVYRRPVARDRLPGNRAKPGSKVQGLRRVRHYPPRPAHQRPHRRSHAATTAATSHLVALAASVARSLRLSAAGLQPARALSHHDLPAPVRDGRTLVPASRARDRRSHRVRQAAARDHRGPGRFARRRRAVSRSRAASSSTPTRAPTRISSCRTSGTSSASVTRSARNATLTCSPASRWAASRRSTSASAIATRSASSSACIRRSTCAGADVDGNPRAKFDPRRWGWRTGYDNRTRGRRQLRRRRQAPHGPGRSARCSASATRPCSSIAANNPIELVDQDRPAQRRTVDVRRLRRPGRVQHRRPGARASSTVRSSRASASPWRSSRTGVTTGSRRCSLLPALVRWLAPQLEPYAPCRDRRKAAIAELPSQCGRRRLSDTSDSRPRCVRQLRSGPRRLVISAHLPCHFRKNCSPNPLALLVESRPILRYATAHMARRPLTRRSGRGLHWRIRHKLMLGMGLVVAIMALLLAGTLKGLSSYRATMRTMRQQAG